VPGVLGCSAHRAEPELQIVNVLNAQADAWNRGDLDGFMEPYWKSDELTYSAAGQTTSGWSELLARYRDRYPTAERMGRLEFDQLRIRLLGPEAALAIGRWHVDRGDDPVGGTFSLVLQLIDGRWVIVHDHTSALRALKESAAAQVGASGDGR
jgi:hypothetical protein